MSKLFALAIAVVGCAPIEWSTHGTGPVASSRADTPSRDGNDRAALWKRFNVRDIAIGTPMSRLAGFRCKGTGVSEICEKVLNPQVCNGECDAEHDDRIEYLRVRPAAAETRRIFEVEYRFRNTDYLSPDSALGTALIRKYGKPEVLEPEYRQRALWEGPHGSAGPSVEIWCGQGSCTLKARDDGFRFEEERNQERLEIARQKANAGPPPKL